MVAQPTIVAVVNTPAAYAGPRVASAITGLVHATHAAAAAVGLPGAFTVSTACRLQTGRTLPCLPGRTRIAAMLGAIALAITAWSLVITRRHRPVAAKPMPRMRRAALARHQH